MLKTTIKAVNKYKTEKNIIYACNRNLQDNKIKDKNAQKSSSY